MALFSLATGVLVLFGAVAANRYQRVREAAVAVEGRDLDRPHGGQRGDLGCGIAGRLGADRGRDVGTVEIHQLAIKIYIKRFCYLTDFIYFCKLDSGLGDGMTDQAVTEMARAVELALREQFGLSERETRELADLAAQEAEEAVSLYQFTGLINRHFSPGEKLQVVENLWRVALADGVLDKYEEALVRKISELIYVPHRDFMQAKHRVQDAMRRVGSSPR